MTRTIIRGSIEYLDITVTADVTLDTQPVAISFDRTTWHDATWVGDVGTSRTARLLIDGDNMPAKATTVYVRLTDTPEIPLIEAGTLQIT